METKTPPNPTGFNRKPNRKPGHAVRKGKSHNPRKASAMPDDNACVHWLAGTFFLMCAAELLAPLYPDKNGYIPTGK